MRWIILGIVGVLAALTVVAYAVILPEQRQRAGLMLAYFDAARAIDEGAEAPGELRALLDGFADSTTITLPAGGLGAVADLTPGEREPYLDAMADYLNTTAAVDFEAIPTLVWSTDDNPARRSQLRLFRAWHLLTYAEPCDIVADPSNRDITKTVVQCVAGAGPDLIEGYGPAELRPFVQAGVAHDITDEADAGGFGIGTVFDAAHNSIAFEGRQYAYPCNVGYTVLFYHKDLFEQAGVPTPSGPWTLDEASEAARRVMAHVDRPNFQGLMNLGGWDIALGAGGRFFNEAGTAPTYDSPETRAGFRAMLEMMYTPEGVPNVMPSPEEAASMSAAGGAAMNATAESATASSLFASKSVAMYIGGRWEYTQLAARNRDRVIVPALERAVAAAQPGSAREALLTSTIDTLEDDVLLPLTDEQYDAMRDALTDDDREKLVHLGVAHVPTGSGTPYYSVSARFTMANRASPNREYAVRFLRFLASEPYNEQINQTFDSICGVPAYCYDEDGISGPPRPLPGLEAMDSPIFIEAVEAYGVPDQLSPYIGRGRTGSIAGLVIEELTNNRRTAENAAETIQARLDRQMRANIAREAPLRQRWERETGLTFDPGVPLREQLRRAGNSGESDGGGGSAQ